MLKNHFKIAIRNLLKRKEVTFINILGLALGFGCSILIFLFVDHHLSFDNFHKNADRIYRFVSVQDFGGTSHLPTVPPPFVNTFKTNFTYAEQVAKIYHWGQDIVTVKDKETISYKENISFAQPEFFKIFDFPLLNGKHRNQLSEPNTALITENIANKLFGNSNPINQTFILANKEVIRVTGILKNLPKNTFLVEQILISFKTLVYYNEFLASESWSGTSSELQCFSLLHPNQSIINIENDLEKLAAKHKEENGINCFKLQPLDSVHLDSTYTYGVIDAKMLWILVLIGFFLILIGCINFINISTTQSIYRSKEVGVKKILGINKNHLFWQYITETFLVSFIALFLGLICCFFIISFLNNIFDISLSLKNILTIPFSIFITLLLFGVPLLAGSYPGFILARISPLLAIKGQVTENDTGGHLTRKILVTFQFAISMVLIIATLIVGQQLEYAINSDLGFDTEALIMVKLPAERKPSQLRSLRDKFIVSANIKQVSACFSSPGAANHNWSTSVYYDNRTEHENFGISVKIADQQYLQTFGLKLVAGRNFIKKDTVDEILVNEAFGKKLGINSPSELLGKQLSLNGHKVKGKIVGVVKDFHDQDFRQEIHPIFISPNEDIYNEMAIKIDLSNLYSTLENIEKQWKSTFPNYIFEYSFLDERVKEMYRLEQQFLSLIRIFSFLAIFIGCLGIYGLMSFLITQKTKEIGIRKVLGGSVIDILGLFALDFVKLIAIAGVIATPLAWYFMSNWLDNFTYRTQIDWWVFVLAIGLVLAITLIIIGYKGIKAAMENPIKNLRSE